MKRKYVITNCLNLFLCVFSSNSFAHHTAEHAIVLHTNDKWDECAMVIDPSLTQEEWKTFARDIASIIYFKPTTGAKNLGKGKFDISIESAVTEPLQDYNGSWNNTFSHPTSDHWLVGDDHKLQVPVITAHYGVADKIDVGIVYTNNFSSNYGWTGVDVKYAFLNISESRLSVATRLSAVMLTGVDDFDYYQSAVDLLASKDFKWFTPYAGIAGLYSVAIENTSKVALKHESAASMEAIVGTQLRWKYLSVGAEADIARINMYSIKIGASF